MWNILILVSAVLAGCATGYANTKALTNQEDTWRALYIEANTLLQKKSNTACTKFTNLSKLAPPSKELSELVSLRQNQSCADKTDPTDIVSLDWLKSEALQVGLEKNTQKIVTDPARVSKYIATENQLPTLESLRLLYKEKKQYARNAVIVAQNQKQPSVVAELLLLFPVLNLDFGYSIAPDIKPRLADDLRFERRFDEARKYYLEIVNESLSNFKKANNLQKKLDQLDILYKASMNIRLAYRLENNKNQGIVETLNLKNFLLGIYQKNKKVEYLKYYHDCVTQYARDVWTEGDRTLAYQTIDGAEKIIKGKYSLAQIYWLKGRMEQEAKNFLKASQWLKLCNLEQVPKQLQTDYEWTYAWNEYKLGHLDVAISEFLKLKKLSTTLQDTSTYYKTIYWLSKAYEATGKNSDAHALYIENFEQNTFGYYGVLSKLDLIDRGEGSLLDFNSNLALPNGLIHQALNTGYWLSLINENDLLARYVSYYWRTAIRGGKTVSIIESLLKLCALADHLENGQHILIDVDNDTRKSVFKDYSRWYFSTPYFSEVEKQSSRFNVEYEFSYSIMRQESLFNEKARSTADAFGLLQLLPRVAELEAKKIGINYTEPEDLFDPHVNIPIGVHYMSAKYRFFNSSWLLTAAGYNGGDDSVANWIKTRFTGDSFKFIEDIPYSETQGYVKTIFRNYFFYNILDQTLSEKQEIAKIREYFKIDLLK